MGPLCLIGLGLHCHEAYGTAASLALVSLISSGFFQGSALQGMLGWSMWSVALLHLMLLADSGLVNDGKGTSVSVVYGFWHTAVWLPVMQI